MTERIALAVALVALGLAAAAWFDRDPAAPIEIARESGPATAAPDSTRAEVAALRELLLEEVVAREKLEAEVAALRRAPGSAKASSAGSKPPAEPAQAPWFDDASLRSAGISAEDVARMRARFEELELDGLTLRDNATREGWLATPRFAQESRQLEERRMALRGEFGDDRYDWYLYAQDRPNRVEIRDVLASSPGAQAGLRSGDLVLSYDGARVFALDELVRATSAGRSGEQVSVELERSGERVRSFVRRGPLGVRLGARRVRPAR